MTNRTNRVEQLLGSGAKGKGGGRGPLRRRRRQRRLRSTSVLPTLFTLGNLVAGFAAIHYATKPTTFEGPWGWSGLMLAGLLVFVGMFFDAVDGSVARMTRSSSTLGAQLDSLCDMVTFGVAPAYMTLRLVINYVEIRGVETSIIGPEADSVYGKVLWAAAAIYVCCAALRLARFNVETELEPDDHRSFRGLPTPGAAGCVASLVMLHQHLLALKFPPPDVPEAFVRGAALGIPFIMLLCAFAMVSNIRYDHFVNRFIRGKRSFTYVVWFAIIAVLAVVWIQESLAIALTVYAASGPVRHVFRLWRERRRKRAAAAGATHQPEG